MFLRGCGFDSHLYESHEALRGELQQLPAVSVRLGVGEDPGPAPRPVHQARRCNTVLSPLVSFARPHTLNQMSHLYS